MELFDVSKHFRIGIISGDRKVVTVRYPTDDEWCERSRRTKGIRQQLGRGRSKPLPTSTERIDADLYAKIRIDGPGLDGAEASDIIAKLDRATVTEVTREGGGYRLKLQQMRYETSHLLRIPTKREVMVHDRMAVDPVDAGRLQEIRVFLEPSGELYDKLVISNEGYTGAVPITHKFAVVYDLLTQLRRDEEEAEEDDDPEAMTPATSGQSRPGLDS